MINLSVIIVLYNEFELVKKCIFSIYEQGINSMEIILVDNSTDKKGHKKIIKKFPKVMYITSGEDLGFAGGVNFGIEKAKGEIIVVLTPDMYLLPATIKETLHYLRSHPKVGMVGCRVYSSEKTQEASVLSMYPNLLTLIYYYNMPFYKIARRFSKNFNPMYVDRFDHERIIRAKAISGQYMILRKKAILQIGKFDSRFFLYFEDIDVCKRLNEEGWKVVYLPIGGIVQNGISNWKKTKITQALFPYMQSMYLFFEKHYGKPYEIFAFFIGIFSVVISVIYLFVVSNIKKIFGISSQATVLFPLWIRIVRWHFTRGLQLIFLNKKTI